jgi:Tol biopolymer transport system component
MDPDPSHAPSPTDASPTGDRLDSWKEIASYLKRSVRTVHRWENEEGLPVHRQLHKDLGSVFAYKRELDAWSGARSVRASPRDEEHTPASATPYRTMVTAALVGSMVLIGAIAYLAPGRSVPARSGQNAPVAGLELISTFPGSHRWPTLSPDGRTVAFVSDAGGTPQVWIKNLATGDPIQITFGDLPAVRPRWSTEGERIVYSLSGGGVWSVPPLGGEPRQIVKDGLNADVSPDGRRLVFERAGRIFIAGADGDGASQLPRLPGKLIEHYGDSWPTFSPDGKYIAVFLGEQGRYGDYWIVPSDGSEPRRVTSDLQEGGAPSWTADGKALVVASARSGSVNLWRVPVAGGPAEALTTGSGEDLDPVVSPDGRTLLFANVKRTWALVAQDVHSGTRRTLLEKRTPLAFPRYSPDGGRIALMGRNSRGEMQLFAMDADGSNFTAVTDGSGELNIMPQWSGDGEALYFYQVRPSLTFRRVSITGGVSREVAPWSFGRQYQAAVEPRERTAVYSSLENGDLRQSRARNLTTGSESVFPFALYEQRFSRDGRLIAGESRSHEVLVCERGSGRCRPLTPKHDRALVALAWSGDSTRLFFLRHTGARVWGELTSVAVDEGAVKVHGQVGPFERDFQMWMDMSPREEIVFAICREGPHELWLARLQ